MVATHLPPPSSVASPMLCPLEVECKGVVVQLQLPNLFLLLVDDLAVM